MPLLSRVKQVALKAEAVEGTAETLTNSEVKFECEDAGGSYENEFHERVPLRATLSQVALIGGKTHAEITGKLELVAGGATTTVPPCEGVLLMSGLKKYTLNSVVLTGAPTGTFRPGEKFTDGGTKVSRFVTLIGTTLYYATISGAALAAADALVGSKSAATATVHGTPALTARGFFYAPQDPDDASSYTIQCDEDGVNKLAYGARSTFTIGVEGTGKVAYLNFTAMGTALKPSDVALLTGVTLPTVLPETLLAGQLSVDGATSLCIDGFTFDLGNTLAPRVCASAATGIKSYRITNRKPTLAFSPEKELEATVPFWTKYDAATQFGVYIQVGTTATRKVAIVAPNAQYTALPTGDREGLATYEAAMRLNGSEINVGDDEFGIAFF